MAVDQGRGREAARGALAPGASGIETGDEAVAATSSELPTQGSNAYASASAAVQAALSPGGADGHFCHGCSPAQSGTQTQRSMLLTEGSAVPAVLSMATVTQVTDASMSMRVTVVTHGKAPMSKLQRQERAAMVAAWGRETRRQREEALHAALAHARLPPGALDLGLHIRGYEATCVNNSDAPKLCAACRCGAGGLCRYCCPHSCLAQDLHVQVATCIPCSCRVRANLCACRTSHLTCAQQSLPCAHHLPLYACSTLEPHIAPLRDGQPARSGHPRFFLLLPSPPRFFHPSPMSSTLCWSR